MVTNGKILLAKSGNKDIYLYPKMANRHGLIAGVTGSGKTVTLKVLAESFSNMGVPVFMADIKGDLGSVCKKGEPNQNVQNRVAKMNLQNWSYDSFPTRFWDLSGVNGHPVRTTISDMGPMLISRLLGLSEAQEGVLDILFRIADDKGWKLIDLKDLRTMLNYVGENRKDYTTEYGNVSAQSVGAILRSLIRLEDEGGKQFLGEPAFDFNDFLACDEKGRGYINILHSVNLIQTPTIYSFFLLWLLSDLFEKLPEVGDCAKPKLVFFFDEAHLLFNEMPSALLEKIVQVVKLIRSKGVGVYFISQSPGDIPDPVLAQLNNRVQHTLHAYTPAEQKAVHTAAFSFRPNPAFNTEEVISQLGIGEALVSTLQEDGTPSIVERCNILPPQSFMGTITQQEREDVINSSEIKGKYDVMIDNVSAYEKIVNPSAYTEETTATESSEKMQCSVDNENATGCENITVDVATEEEDTENSADKWVCSCGNENVKKFCTECGTPKPKKKSEKEIWTCECGQENNGKFCGECGKKKPENQKWKCICGAENKSKFCTECGKPKSQNPQPNDSQWKCLCGTVNKGAFCHCCGAKKINNGISNNRAYDVNSYTQQSYNQQFNHNYNQQYSPQSNTNKNNSPNQKELTFSEKIARGLFGSKK